MPKAKDVVDAVARAVQGVVWGVEDAGKRGCDAFNAAAEAYMDVTDGVGALISGVAEKVGIRMSGSNVSYGITFVAPFVTGVAGVLIGRSLYRRR